MTARPMRRTDRELERGECLAFLREAEYGVLATVGSDGQPYGVPLSFWIDSEALYFHCTRKGYKLDNLAVNPRVSFTVAGNTRPVYDKGFTTRYTSVIVFGAAREVLDDTKKAEVLRALAEKYLPAHHDRVEDTITRLLSHTAVYAVDMETVTGKANRPKSEDG